MLSDDAEINFKIKGERTMTKDEIHQLKRGKYMTTLVAEKVMGWKRETLDNGYGYPADFWTNENGEKVHPVNFWSATRLEDSWEVVEKLRESWFVRLEDCGPFGWIVRLGTTSSEKNDLSSQTYLNITEAISKAALLSVMEGTEES